MQNKWSKVSKYCIERNNFYISRYTLADGANRYVLWNSNKMIKIYDDAKVLKDEAEKLDGQSAEHSPISDLFGRINQRRQDTSSYDKRKS
jgi:hypothetical protein